MKGGMVSIFLIVALLLTGSSSSLTPVGVLYICPAEPLQFTCESTGLLLIQWRIMFDSRSESAETHQYVKSHPEGDIHTVARNGLNMVFNLTENSQSRLVSTLTVTLRDSDTGTTSVSNTTVYCGQESHLKTVIFAREPPIQPAITNLSLITSKSSENGSTVALEWVSSDATMVDDYSVMISSITLPLSMFSTSNTSIQLFIPYNQDYNISVVACNCAGNSTPAETSLRIGYCAPPYIRSDVIVESSNSEPGVEGSVITYFCQWFSKVPSEQIVAKCLSNGSWSPDPSDLECPENQTSSSVYSLVNSTTTDPSSIASDRVRSNHNGLLVPLTMLLVVASSFTVIIFVFIAAYIAHQKFQVHKGKNIVNGSPEIDLPVSDEDDEGVRYQMNDNTMLQEQGIYSLLREEDNNQLSDSKNSPGQLIYADIGSSALTHAQRDAPISGPYPSLSVQLDDSQVQYADVRPHQSTNDSHTIMTDTEADLASSTILSDDSLDLNTLLIQLRSEVTLRWREFGLAVGLAEELLDKYSKYPPEECIVEVLDVWLRNYHCDINTTVTDKPTWKDVAKALKKIELHQLANNILSMNKNGEVALQIDMDAVPSGQQNTHVSDDLSPPLPPKMVDFDEEMKLSSVENQLQFESGKPPPLPPPYKETNMKQMLCSSAPPVPPKNNLQI